MSRLAVFLAEPRTAHACFPCLYKRKIGPGEYGLAMVEAVAHLNHLLVLGKVRRSTGPDGAYLWQAI
ncbi:MAG: hypothetical protein ACJA1F_003416 [Paracoccaceae bacterium]